MIQIREFLKDFNNAICAKKPIWVHLLEFIAGMAFSFCTGMLFDFKIIPTIITAMCICAIIFPFIYLFSYYLSVNDNIENLYENTEENHIRKMFLRYNDTVEEYDKTYNVYKLWFLNRSNHFRFSIFEYANTREELFKFWNETSNVKDQYLLYNVELVKERTNNDSNI